jgi:hypothetical protein
MRINEIQQQVGDGAYRVDTQAVAAAILRRLMAGQDPAGSWRAPRGAISRGAPSRAAHRPGR